MKSSGIQLFLLPFAGGNSRSFDQVVERLDKRIDAITVEYAGRASRRKDEYITEYSPFLEDVASYIRERRDNRPWALLGYSLGSVFAYDISSRIMMDDNPFHVFVCARGDLKERYISQGYAGLEYDEFLEKMRALGGIDERLLKNRRFLEIFMEPTRKDYFVWADYEYVERGNRIPCDTTVIFSKKDPLSVGAEKWAQYCSGKVDFYEMGENHFFIKDCYAEIAKIINDKVSEII
jgi:surfactin synthase thioesterase subunit